MSKLNWNSPAKARYLPEMRTSKVFDTIAPTLERRIKVSRGHTNLPKNLYRSSRLKQAMKAKGWVY